MISGEPGASEIDLVLAGCLQQGTLIICGAVYAELLAHPQAKKTFINFFLSDAAIQVDFRISEEIWTEVGIRYARYAVRRRAASAEGPRRILADFLIGAHALALADRLLTLDTRVYTQYFDDLELRPVRAL